MKQCLNCGSIYADESLRFCLIDGIALVDNDEQATMVIVAAGQQTVQTAAYTPQTDPSLPGSQLRVEVPQSPQTQTMSATPPTPNSSTNWLKITAVGGVLGVVILGTVVIVMVLIYLNGGARSVVGPGRNTSTSQTGNAESPKNPFGIEFVSIPAGSFMMGSENGDKDEKPVHRVTISQGFWLGKYEVTQGQWEQVMGTTVRQQRDKASSSYNIYGEGANYPMYYVTWDEAKEFVRRLNEKNDGFEYGLPSEAQWEYAARAGTIGDHYGPIDEIAWFANNSGRAPIDADLIRKDDAPTYQKRIIENGDQTHQVGTKKPNSFGLYDMTGNVWEWCEDIYRRDGYIGLPVDGSANLTIGNSTYRILKGGSFGNVGGDSRSAVKIRDTPTLISNVYGFRVAAHPR